MEAAASAVLRGRVTGARIRFGGPLIPPGIPAAKEAAVAVPPPQRTRAHDAHYRRRHRYKEVPGKIDICTEMRNVGATVEGNDFRDEREIGG